MKELLDFVHNECHVLRADVEGMSSLKELIEKTINEYTTEKVKPLSGNSFADYFRNDAVDIVRNAAGLSEDEYVIIGSVGKGKWADVPWIGILNKKITTKPAKGVYIVYLLNKNGDSMYLTLNQGCRDIKKGNSTQKTIQIMRDKANKLVKQLDSKGFHTDENINLGKGQGELYQKGCIFYKEYKKGMVPAEEELRNDLLKMVKIYNDYRESLECDMINKKGIEVLKKFKAKPNKVSYAKNMILYGPPGTGKTYATVVYAVAIIENKKIEEVKLEPYETIFTRYNGYKKQGLVAFTTFHQSYGYEEFIEGIKPVIEEDSNNIGYTIVDGIFKVFCENAKIPVNLKVNPNSTIWFMRLDSDNSKTIKDECFNRNEVITDIKEDDDWSKKRFVEQMQIGDYIVSYAGNSVYIDAIAVVTGEAIIDDTKVAYKWSRKVKWTKLEKKIDVKAINNDKYLPNFSIAKMNHMKVSDLVSSTMSDTLQKDNSPHVFIIDEINRGNISKIFGELITLIEDTKRAGMAEEASVVLPYSGELFSVPSNVYILGTMNTADRSIAIMDTALRRRFDFIEMMPDIDVLRKIGADKVEDLDVASMLEKINERITFLYDREHTIGHAFFTKLAKEPTIDVLKSIFEKSVIPLLQEYFYEDYQKIQLVLGDNGKSDDAHKFILDTDVKVKEIFKGGVEDIIDLPEKKYTINPEAFSKIDSYKEII